MPYKYREYSDQDIIDKAKEVYSMASLLKALNLIPAGGNYSHMRKQLTRLNIDVSHWLGQGWKLGIQEKTISEYITNKSAKSHLITIRGHKCESCNLSEWLSQPIMIELDHMDGNGDNYELNNLKLLCPNCHSQTHNWRGRTLMYRSRL